GRSFRMRPGLSSAQILEWLHRLRRFRYDEETTLGRRIAEIAPTLGNRAVIMVLSDLHDPSALPALKLLAQKHDCAVLQLQDPAERGLRGGGFLRAREAETGRGFVTRARRSWPHPGEVACGLLRAGAGHPLPGHHE